MIARSTIALALVLCCSISYAEDAVSIPLDQIWGYQISGTRNIKDLEPEIDTNTLSREELLQKSLVQQIRRSLNSYRRHQNKETAGTSFIVAGTGSTALKKAHAVLVGGEERPSFFQKDDELTLVFYSYEWGRYIPLDGVTRKGNDIEIQYHFAAHNTANMSTHFALIPIGKMSPGTARVNIKQLPGVGPDWGPKAAEIGPELVRQLVCGPTSFNIE